MNQEYIAHLRQKLQRKVDHLLVQPPFIFYNAHKSFWIDVKKDYFLQSIVNNLEKKYPQINSKIQKIFEEQNISGFDLYEESNFRREEYIAHLYFITQQCVVLNSNFQDDNPQEESCEIYAGRQFNSLGRLGEEAALDNFKQEIIQPLYHYIDNQIVERKLTVEFIRRYKQKCESVLF